jgi:hypothetical protein
MKKIILRYFLLFVLIFLGVFGLQNVFLGIFIEDQNQLQVIIVGISFVLADILYYYFIYRKFYPTK